MKNDWIYGAAKNVSKKGMKFVRLAVVGENWRGVAARSDVLC